MSSDVLADFINANFLIFNYNQLTEITCSMFENTRINRMEVTRNSSTQFPDLGCIKDILETLDLGWNQIQTVNTKNLADLYKIEVLFLKGNLLKTIELVKHLQMQFYA
jgi:Leucine-rich repeat (LRR) protein